MTNPFLDKSLTELRDGVPGYTDPELNALCACVCDGQRKIELKDILLPEIYCVYVAQARPYTTDGHEAMRLLVKYHLGIKWEKCSSVEDICRAITEAAVVAELTQMIEGDGDA